MRLFPQTQFLIIASTSHRTRVSFTPIINSQTSKNTNASLTEPETLELLISIFTKRHTCAAIHTVLPCPSCLRWAVHSWPHSPLQPPRPLPHQFLSPRQHHHYLVVRPQSPSQQSCRTIRPGYSPAPSPYRSAVCCHRYQQRCQHPKGCRHGPRSGQCAGGMTWRIP